MQHRMLDRLLLLLLRHSWTVSQRLTVTVTAEVGGQPFRVPLLYGIGLQNLAIIEQDLPLARAVQAALRTTDAAIVDVGCNIGHFLQLCLLSERERPYVGFDPSLACCFYVERFIRENRLPVHSVVPIGLGARSGTGELRSNGAFDVCATFSAEAHPQGRFRQRSQLRIEPGDLVLAQLAFPRVGLLKIDVEGLELDVLQGLTATIDAQRPLVIFEVLRYADLAATGSGPDVERAVAYRRAHARELGAYFGSRDYVVFKLCRDTELRPVTELDPGPATDPVEMDHIAVPRERAADFQAAHAALPVHGAGD